MKKIGRYEIIDQLGRGSMAVIYRAKDTALDREIALKTLSIDGFHDPELLERFYREARSCAKLRHPNLVTVFDFGKQEDVAYIAMELLEGSDLRRIIADRVSIPLERKLQIMAGVCSALAHAHAHGIIHRDIKPSNIFVETSGQPKLLDFGIAYVPASNLTVLGRSLGTPQYMSPEQLEGHSCDARSDIFSMAVVIYEFVSGQHRSANIPGNRLSRAPSLLEVLPGCPPELNVTLQRALAQSPQMRLASAAELAAVLSEASGKIGGNSLSDEPLPPIKTQSRLAGTETILSAVLVNLQKFDEAVDRGDLAAARSALTAMQRAGAQDNRYAVALEQSAKRLAQIETSASPVVAQKAPASDDQTGLLTLPLKPLDIGPLRPSATASHLAVPFPALLNPTTFAERLEEPAHPFAYPADVSPAPPAAAVPSAPVARKRARFRIGRLLLLCLGIFACGIAGVYFSKLQFSTPPPRMRSVALARVVPTEAFLFTSPDSSHSPAATVHQGDSLDVLRTPRFREQQWTEVQQVSGMRLSPILFIRTANLGNWSSSDPAVEQKLQEMFGRQANQ